MRRLLVVVPVLAIAAGVAIVAATRDGPPPLERASAANGDARAADPMLDAAGTGAAAARAADAPGATAATSPPSAAHVARGTSCAPGDDTIAPPRRAAWPVPARRSKGRGGGSEPPADGAVPVALAFWALWYLGVDPAAETTWARAINDPRQPAGVRSDLIVDMIDEGYTDNDRPGVEDLALIRTRLEILERHWPHAMDEVNAKAFEDAYRTLLSLYLRLGGEARIPVQSR